MRLSSIQKLQGNSELGIERRNETSRKSVDVLMPNEWSRTRFVTPIIGLAYEKF